MKQELFNSDIKLSYQRLKIYEYLSSRRNHPTAEQIYSDLKGEIPTLSKTTVYNTLNTFSDKSIVQKLNIEDNEVRYDIDTSDHGHFKCKECGRVYDFNLDLDCIKTLGLDGFRIESKNVFFKGVCKKCLKNKKNSISREVE